VFIPYFWGKENQRNRIEIREVSCDTKLTLEMEAKVPMIWEKSENVFHFYFIPSLPLPSGERGRVRGYEVKCS
jgi:hypothetical protein